MSKKTKGSHGISSSKDDTRNYVPGWFGGRLTSPLAQKAARECMQERMRARVISFVEARERLSYELPDEELDQPQPAFAP